MAKTLTELEMYAMLMLILPLLGGKTELGLRVGIGEGVPTAFRYPYPHS